MIPTTAEWATITSVITKVEAVTNPPMTGTPLKGCLKIQINSTIG